MRKFAIILCLLANLSLLLMPFATAHAHIERFASTSTAEFHGGHHHDFDQDADHDHDTDGSVVDLTDSFRAQPKPDHTFWSDWVTLACLIALAICIAQLCTLVLVPPRSDPKPASRSGYWRPPLRGPPVFSVP